MIGPEPDIVPSLMFHSVGLQDAEWSWAGLSEAPSTFEHKLRVITERGFYTVMWEDVYDHVAGKRRLPKSSVMLTFDDGYLDNWVFVWPLLKKYGAKATIFVSSDFIEPDGPPRPTLEDVWSGKVQRSALDIMGFLRPSEIRAMIRSGLVDIQSHASTHTWLYTENHLVDVYDPRKYRKYPWMAWNARPDRKPYYLNEDQSAFVSSGEPIFQHDKAIVARQFVPDSQAVDAFKSAWSTAHCTGQAESDQLAQAHAIERKLGFDNGWPGKYETDNERALRVREELNRSREVLTALTDRVPEYLAWPGGAYDAIAVQIAFECGFKSYTLGSRDDVKHRNRPGADPSRLKRISTNSRLRVRGVFCGTQDGHYQWLLIRAHQNSFVHTLALLAHKTRAVLMTLFDKLRR